MFRIGIGGVELFLKSQGLGYDRRRIDLSDSKRAN